MMRRIVMVMAIVSGLLVSGGALVWGSAAGAAPGRPKRAAATAKRPVAHAKRSSAKAKQVTAKADSTARLAGGPRRLEDIHIEGEIPAPQVLFVTARDQRRFTRFHHQRYLKTSVQVGETTQLPTRIALTSHPPTPAGAP